MLKLLSLPKGVPISQFESNLIHNLESKEDLKKVAFFDTFKWNIINWKSMFTGED